MTQVISEVSICNQALSWLKVAPITSLADSSVAAELCKLNYPQLRDAVLEERMWTFSTARAVSEVQDLDEWGVLFKHPMPLDWLGVFRVFRGISGSKMLPDTTWRLEQQAILSQNSKIYLWGVEQVTDTKKFTSMFVQTLAARIAADLAIPLTNDIALQGVMWQLYGAKLQEAAARDGMQGENDIITQTQLVDARYTDGWGLN